MLIVQVSILFLQPLVHSLEILEVVFCNIAPAIQLVRCLFVCFLRLIFPSTFVDEVILNLSKRFEDRSHVDGFTRLAKLLLKDIKALVEHRRVHF